MGRHQWRTDINKHLPHHRIHDREIGYRHHHSRLSCFHSRKRANHGNHHRKYSGRHKHALRGSKRTTAQRHAIGKCGHRHHQSRHALLHPRSGQLCIAGNLHHIHRSHHLWHHRNLIGHSNLGRRGIADWKIGLHHIHGEWKTDNGCVGKCDLRE